MRGSHPLSRSHSGLTDSQTTSISNGLKDSCDPRLPHPEGLMRYPMELLADLWTNSPIIL